MASMDDWDEDNPPPLGSLPDQIHAAQLSSSITGTAMLKAGDMRVAATTHAQKQVSAASAATKPFRRGFLDSKPQQQQAGKRSKQGAPIIKAKPDQQQSKQIPAMFKLEPSEEQKRYNMMKTQLLGAMAPTPDTVAAVSSNPVLAAGFEDPEVMKVVAEVARDPSAIKKYANHAKVQQFYMAFGSMMGSKLEAVSNKQSSKSSSSSQTTSSGNGSYPSKREYLP